MMKGADKRTQSAIDRALESMDYILETASTPDYVQIVGSVGGDVITRRYYDDGTICAK